MRSGIKVVLCFVIASVLFGFTQMPFVSAISSTPNVFEILSYGGDITFIGGNGMTKMIVIGAEEFHAFTFTQSTDLGPNAEFVRILSGGTIYAPADLPNGSTITEFECKIFLDTDAGGEANCELFETEHGGVPSSLSFLNTPQHLPDVQTLTDSTLSENVDRNSNRYYVAYTATETCSNNLCHLLSMKITYTIPSSGITVGGDFYPVDNVSLVLAYGLVNSWWMAPIGIGIGVGIYLVKRKF